MRASAKGSPGDGDLERAGGGGFCSEGAGGGDGGARGGAGRHALPSGTPPAGRTGGDCLSRRGVRVFLISLARCAERRGQAQAHLRETLGAPFATFEAKDGKRWAAHAARGVQAFEEEAGARVWRSWPVQEEGDARRAVRGEQHAEDAAAAAAAAAAAGAASARADAQAHTGAPDGAAAHGPLAWMAYERLFRVWHAERARDYVDSHCRRLTVGDVGCTLSHVGVWQRALAEGVQVAAVFEDDARPRQGALQAALDEGELARANGVDWHLLYIHSSKYERRPEAAVEGTRLVRAAHRKLTDAYLISAEGMRAALAANLHATGVFPIDDFLPALYGSGHPRPDVMRHAGVLAARAAAGGELVALAFAGDEGGPGTGGWFGGASASDGEAAQLSVNLARTAIGRSQSNRAAIIIGDYGVDTHGDNNDDHGEDADAEMGGPARAPAAEICSPAGAADVDGILSRLRERSWALVRFESAGTRELMLEVQAAWAAFFERSIADAKAALTPSCRRHGELRLWGCGHSAQQRREQVHVVTGAWEVMRWPEIPHERCEGLSARACEALKALAVSLLRAASTEVDAARAAYAATAGDSSALDIFRYHGDASAVQLDMGDHTDPGFLTLTPASATAGLEVFDALERRWVAAEAMGCADSADVLVMTADILARDVVGYPPCRHRVRAAAEPRLSVVYELRGEGC